MATDNVTASHMPPLSFLEITPYNSHTRGATFILFSGVCFDNEKWMELIQIMSTSGSGNSGAEPLSSATTVLQQWMTNSSHYTKAPHKKKQFCSQKQHMPLI
jgi:hypothetical protein